MEISVKVDMHHQILPVILGDLEISLEISAKMESTVMTNLNMQLQLFSQGTDQTKIWHRLWRYRVGFWSKMSKHKQHIPNVLTSLSGWPQLKVLPFWPAYQVATLVKRKSWKGMMDSGRNPREGISLSLGSLVRWLLVVALQLQTMHTIWSQ